MLFPVRVVNLSNVVKAEYDRESLLSKIVEAHPIFVVFTNVVNVFGKITIKIPKNKCHDT